MNLPLPNPEIDPIPEIRISRIRSFAAAMERISDGASAPRQDSIDEVKRRIEAYKNNQCSFAAVVDTSEMARTFLAEYSARKQLREAIPFTSDIALPLCQILATYPTPLARLYFEHYNDLEAFNTLREFLLSCYEKADGLTHLTRKNQSYVDNAEIIFGGNGPSAIAFEATESGKSLREVERQYYLPTNGAFHDQAYRWYYVNHAQELSFGEISPILKETLSPTIHTLPLEGATLGHHLILTLVQRCITLGKTIPAHWLTYILKIAGDPRLPATHQRFQKYWALQSPAIIKKVKAALAKRDLGFFLKLLEQFARMEGGDFARMYPPRMKFLNGFLSVDDAIQDALLILSPSGKEYIERQLDPEERQDFQCTILTKANKDGQCAIYLELPNGHLIEGSHQSRLRLYASNSELPTRLRDERPKKIEYPEITRSQASFEQGHNPNVNWQFKVLSHLSRYDYGVDIDPEKSLSEIDYNFMIQRYGIPK
ncbi:EH signature domain-containing protein [Akkermansiaceae bacterium]|nr:EH signature domain-containing protein [Akkermansiaceae bacterium]MDB4740788.1 EH signature domain-containing protein [Akkermansiaceae bacterium]